MDHPDTHGEHGQHGAIHLPDPSIWPLVAGLAAFILGAALIYYSRDRDANFSGPLLGAAAIIALIAGCGWAYEDGRMKRKAEEGLHSDPRNVRYTQVVTFAIAEGQYAASRGEGGIVALLEATDNSLRDLDGFQDMRLIVSPAEGGPSQVIVETTWADREGLATYEETRSTMLDLLSQHPEEVVPGSVQVFDMEVIRDTKDTSFNFGTGAMVGTFSAMIVGGFMVGAGLNMFASDHAGGASGEVAEPVAANVITARNTKYTTNTTITAPPKTQITLVMDNKDASPPHNVQVFAGSAFSPPLLKGCTAGCEGEGDEVYSPLKGAGRYEFTFTTPDPGEYAFSCAAHPTMTGKLVIQANAPIPGAAPPPAAASPGAGTPAASSSPTVTR